MNKSIMFYIVLIDSENTEWFCYSFDNIKNALEESIIVAFQNEHCTILVKS